MAMDWTSALMGGYASQPQEDVEDDEDFYGNDQTGDANGEADTTAGAQMDEPVGNLMFAFGVPLTTIAYSGHPRT